MTMNDAPRYYAVPDPADPDRMTYWRQTSRRRAPWPPKGRPGPRLLRTDVPADLTGGARQDWILTWFRTNQRPWEEQVRAAIEADPELAMARFAAFAFRCCRCGRRLTDPTSKTYGIGPECRAEMPPEHLAALAAAVARIHGHAVHEHPDLDQDAG